MTIGLLVTDRDLDELQQGLKNALPDVNVIAWPDIEAMVNADFVVTWRQPDNIWKSLPNAKVICSLGAGVDGLINDSHLSHSVPIIRIVDESLSAQMADFVLASVLMRNCRLDSYVKQQVQNEWAPLKRLYGKQIALLGVGQIGQAVGKKLHANGFNVVGWNRRSAPDVSFVVKTGEDKLPEVLANADYVVSILPATSKTYQLVDKSLFALMPSHACFINVGRGSTVNEDDLLFALDNNVISSAILDVFQHEPLTKSHPFWQHNDVTITPHVAAITNQAQVIKQIADNYLSYVANQPLMNIVDRKVGY